MRPDPVTVRELVPADRPLVAAGFARLSPRSRLLRFLSPLPSLPESTLDRLMAVDGDEHVALVALRGGEAIGVARYVRDAEHRHSAELAITVVDAEQGQGLGRRLLVALLDVAADRGLHVLTFDAHPGNHAMRGLARSLGARMGWRDGLVHGTLATPRSGGLAAAA
jgi:RimJ/RimL family protein N-acetyltransferase